MKQKKLLYSLSLATLLTIIQPLKVEASDTYFGYTKEEIKDKALEIGGKITNTMEDVEEYINENALLPIKEELKEIEIYSSDTLWLIISNDEDKVPFFVLKNTPIWNQREYYSSFEKVKRNDINLRYIKEKTMYPSLTDTSIFIAETTIDIKTKNYYTNYLDTNEVTKVDSYQRILNWENNINNIKEKYSTKDLENIILEYQTILEETENLERTLKN